MITLKQIPEGSTVMLSSGEYSDYSAYGIYKVLKDINPEELRNEYINLYPEQTATYAFKECMFMKFLMNKGLLEKVEYYEWYLGCYSKISEMKVTLE